MLKRIVEWFKGFLPCSHEFNLFIRDSGYHSCRYFKCNKCGYEEMERGSYGRDW